MPQLTCKVGDDYYDLIYHRNSTKDGTMYYGELCLDSSLDYEYIIDVNGEIINFKPANTNEDIVYAIKAAIEDGEASQSSAGFA